ncbi:MAG: hypothetical protein ACREIF_06460 [Chthoniobacterales bacterium]
MNTTGARWNRLLGEAELLLPTYLEATTGLSHESKGIRRSELFFFYSAAAPLRPARIIESGRARAQSTLVLSRLFPNTSIISLESDAHSPDVAVAAERLRGCDNVECRFGDSLLLLPALVESGDVVLIDGPKDFRALKLAFRLLHAGKPAAVFVHDLWLRSAGRRFIDRHVRSVLLSDEPRWVQRYAMLDSSKPLPAPAPKDARRAYGATMGCFEAGQENYRRRLRECEAAQLCDRFHETARKMMHRPSLARPKDFDVVSM